jgi:hypothetical protein
MVLGSASSTGSGSMVSNTIDSVSKESFSEASIVGYNSSSQMSLLLFEDLKDSVFLGIAELSDNLERSEKLSSQKLEFLGASEVL